MFKKACGIFVSLFIVPILCLGAGYGTYFGGGYVEYGQMVTVDKDGYIYITGYTTSTDLPVTAGAIQPTYNNTNNNFAKDVFVAKFSPNLGSLIYCTYLGGDQADYPSGICVDTAGNAYVAGYTTSSTTLPVTAGAFQTTYNGGADDGFVAKINPTGTSLLYCTYFGGNDMDRVNGISLDSAGNIYLTGLTQSSNFPISATAKQKGFSSWECFISKLNPAGNGILYSTYFGGSSMDYGNGIDVDDEGNAVVTGSTRISNIPITSGVIQPTRGGGDDAFVVKVNADGSDWIYSTYLGGSGADQGRSVSLDTDGSAYIFCIGDSPNFPVTPLAYQTTNHGSYDFMVTKVNSTGTEWLYSTYVGGSGLESSRSMARSAEGKICVTGYTPSGDYPVTPGALYPTRPASYSGFVSVLDKTLSNLLMSTYFGGNTWDESYGVAFTSDETPVICGLTWGNNFPVSAGAFDTSLGGTSDVFVYKFESPVVPVELSDFSVE